jgi:hypothetical protein
MPSAGQTGPYTDRRLQATILLALFLPWTVLALFTSARGLLASLRLDQDLAVSKELAVLLAALSAPHVFYFFVWTHAKTWAGMCAAAGLREPHKAFAMAAHALKAFQMAMLARFFVRDVPQSLEEMSQTLLTFLRALHPFQALLATELFALGQLFNAGVYSAIGEAGVYYGCRLGQDVPWVYGFPFNVVPHPQYLGATLSFWGMVVGLTNADTAQRGVLLIGVAMTVYYAFSSYVEANL